MTPFKVGDVVQWVGSDDHDPDCGVFGILYDIDESFSQCAILWQDGLRGSIMFKSDPNTRHRSTLRVVCTLHS